MRTADDPGIALSTTQPTTSSVQADSELTSGEIGPAEELWLAEGGCLEIDRQDPTRGLRVLRRGLALREHAHGAVVGAAREARRTRTVRRVGRSVARARHAHELARDAAFDLPEDRVRRRWRRAVHRGRRCPAASR